MGLFDNLFKPKSDPAGEEQVEAAQTPETASHSDAAVNLPPPKPPVIAPPDAFGARSLGQIVTPGRAGAPAQRSGPQVKPPGEGNVVREIVLTLDDVLVRIPKEFLGEGAHDGRRILRFSIDDLSADIARGRAAVPLSQIAEQCPDIFLVPIGEDNDVLVRLPLQKLVEQIAPGGISTTLGRGAAGEAPDAKIHLSIAAILRTCPREIIAREMPPVAETERVTFPFAPIERQLPSGRVDVSSIRFVAALPLHMHEYFHAIEGVRVPLPLDEIFQNLPGLPAIAPSPAPMPVSAPPPESSPQSPPPSGVTFTPAPTHPPSSPAASEAAVPSEAAPPVELTPVSKPAPSVDLPRASGFTPASGPAPAPRAVEPPHPEPQATSPVPPRPAPQMDLAKDEIAALRARIAALKVEFSVPSISPTAPPHIKEEPSAEALPKSEPPAKLPEPLESAAVADQIPIQPASVVSPAPLPADFGPQSNEPPSPGVEPPAASESMAASASITVASEPQLDVPPAPGLDFPSLLQPESVFASPPLPASTSAPLPELFRPPLVPPPVAPVVITTPRIVPPGPVMLPTRIVAPPPVRPHVAPPRLFSAGENVPLPEIHPLAPVPEPEPPEPPPPPPPPPLSLDHAYTALGIEGEQQALARVAEHLATLPGLSACVIEVRHEAAEAGVFPEGLDAAGIRALVAPLAAALAGRAGEHISLFSEHGSISVFARGGARLAILHRARVFLPGIREKLVHTTDTLADA